MPAATDKNTAMFFGWLAILLIASVGYGYIKLVIQKDFVTYASEESVPTYIVSSSDAE